MKACDRCLPKYAPATETFSLAVDGIEIDLCEKCKCETLEFIHNQPKEKKRSKLSLGWKKENSAHAEV